MKNLFLLLSIITLAISSCSKNEEAAAVVTEPVTLACFLDSSNGIYVGQSGSTTTGDDVTVKFTKTGCNTCKFESVEMGNKNVVSLSVSAAGSYVGKLNDGKEVSIVLGGTSLIIASETYTFEGTKK